MNETQEKMYELLKELIKICEKEKIDYSINNKLLFDAINNNEITGTYHDFSIVIKSDDIEKLVNAVKDIKNRSIESLRTNKRFPGLHLRYVAEDTLYFHVNKYKVYNKMGFAIDIHPLRYLPKNKKQQKINEILETGIEVLNGRTLKGGKKAKAYALFVFLLGIIGPKRRSKLIYNRIYKIDNLDKKHLYYKPLLAKLEKYDSNIFSKLSDIKLNKDNFKYIKDDNYLNTRLKDYTVNSLNNNYGADYIIDKSISYKAYFKECKKQGVSFDKYIFKRLILGIKNIKIKKYRKYVNHCWDLMYRTRDRFELYEYYKPLKEEIIKLNKKKDYEKLEEILKKYTDLLHYYYTKNMCLVFDPEIFDITKELLINQGKNNYVTDLIKMCPKEHLKPLD